MSDPIQKSEIEIINPAYPRGPFRAAVFDFDGTISLLRRDWQGVMSRMMVAHLQQANPAETHDELHAIAEDIVFRLTGKQTIFQMQALVDEVQKRAGRSREPQEYFLEYDELLMTAARDRIQAIRSGEWHRDAAMVFGTAAFIERLQAAGLWLYLASGTDLVHVRNELALLGLDQVFGEHVYAPLNSDPTFSKLRVMQDLLSRHGLQGDEVLAIGDGATEIAAIKSLGGLGIGVASNEVILRGIDTRKRDFLLRAGADIIIPDYRELEALLALIRLAPAS